MRRIYRVEEDKVVDGVCGGIAEYFDIDPVIVRIIFLLTTLFTGVGLVAYIILCFSISKEE